MKQVRHYWRYIKDAIANPKEDYSACGKEYFGLGPDYPKSREIWTTYPTSLEVTCEDCLASSIYEEDICVLEIGYDGDVLAYIRAKAK